MAHVVDRFPGEAQLEGAAPPSPATLSVACRAAVPSPQLPGVIQELAGAQEGSLWLYHREAPVTLGTSKRRMEWKPPGARPGPSSKKTRRRAL
jgi:hypothetical protein